MNPGDIVKPSLDGSNPRNLEEYKYGIILDTYEDDYGIYYYEVHWTTEIEWWKEDELELISESR